MIDKRHNFSTPKASCAAAREEYVSEEDIQAELKKIQEMADSLYKSYLTAKELSDREKDLFLDSMKRVTGGKGLILTNSK